MNRIESIPVDVQHTAGLTGNLLPLLHELRHALAAFAECGATHSIDLNSLPMAPGELARLEQLLGDGEIHARLQALGDSDIRETCVAGVWRITHRNADGEVVAQLLEVTDCPAIIKTQRPELGEGLHRLEQLIREQA